MGALVGPERHDPRDRERREALRQVSDGDREAGPAPVKIVKADQNGILQRGLLNEGLHVLEEPEQELR
jgi:hypothetical protein